ncbi:NUDIX domain-containing protein [Sporosalibacterium faouarense]|uniref:NUDIX domain-containing protein n=1 Tax=Sporosalibacterium faouarense TaxID=516123 RepID=UPI00141CCD6B|nr:NUDIX domain-containing protein [Sporosalibacterium faouarense]MTI49920.1 NUDIX domain-containing protein [Bacillota bacterium]
MGRIAKISYKLSKVLWRITKPTTLGVRVLMIEQGKVLLVKHTYQDYWYLPGGGVKKGEIFEDAIKREVKEELGAELINYKLFGVYNNFFEYKNDSIIIFSSDEFSFTGNTDKEIEKYQLFEVSELPNNVSRGTRRRIQEYIEDKSPCLGMW